MIKRWKVSVPSADDREITNHLDNELGIGPVLCHLLNQRGIKSFDEAKYFFRPQLKDLHDPFLMKDMEKAVDRLNQAMGDKEKILIYGDYDVDGTTAVALVYSFLRKYYSKIDFYIPDRYAEGYGISFEGIDFAEANDFSLVIALDCGIKSHEKMKYARSKGIDFIICDHHTPDDTLPDAVAVLDPKRPDSIYPFKDLSGCGVGFKFLQGFAINNGIDFSELTKLLDLVAVSIAADIVPMVGENRILSYYGMKQLNTNPCIGLKTIIDISGLANREITVSDIVFKIGPRINASGRVQSGREAVELLRSIDFEYAKAKCLEIDEYNQTRKDLDKNITEEALHMIDSSPELQARKSTVLYSPNWHKGVIGIVASRLTESYYRPTVILTKSNGFATGSARSVANFDLYAAIEGCRDLLENFGGHKFAAGLTLKEENIPEFTKRFEAHVNEYITKEQQVQLIDIDAELNFDDITSKFYRVLKQFRPFGPGNMKPIFVSKEATDFGTSKLVGQNLDHLKLDLQLANSNKVMPGIAFKMGEFNDHLKANKPIDICYSIEENNFNQSTTVQLMIRDMVTSDTKVYH